MQIDQLTIILSAVILFMAIVTPFINPLFRWRCGHINKDDNVDKSSDDLPPVSIVIIAHGNAKQLEEKLPLMLTQDYPSGYQIIVVAERGDGNTEDILKRYSSEKRLYATFIPESSRYMSRKKLAVTIGVKAVHNEWVVLMDASTTPVSDNWLKIIAKNFNSKNNVVLSYTNYNKETSSFYKFERLITSAYLFRKAMKGNAYGTNSSVIAFKKSDFYKYEGYRGNLQFLYGEFDFIVNNYSNHRCTLELSPQSWTMDDEPSKKSWINTHIYDINISKHLRHGYGIRLLRGIDTFTMHVNYLAIIAMAIYSIYIQHWIITIATGLALIVTLILRIIIGRKLIRLFHTDISSWEIIPLEIRLFWMRLHMRLRYACTNKNDFTSHKL